MVQTPLLLALLFAWLIPGRNTAPPLPEPSNTIVLETPAVDEAGTMAASDLFLAIGLDGEMDKTAFAAGYNSVRKHHAKGGMLAIADMTQPSTAKRLYIIDLDNKALVLRTWVAHGQATGELMATHFSNREGSHQTSLGLYRVGSRITSPKHGAALMLHGLDRGVNCQAEKREVIMHGAEYVSADFIAQHGRLGRSWGCPAVDRVQMERMIELLADGGLLFVYGK